MHYDVEGAEVLNRGCRGKRMTIGGARPAAQQIFDALQPPEPFTLDEAAAEVA